MKAFQMKKCPLIIANDLENVIEIKVAGEKTTIAIIYLDYLCRIKYVIFSKGFIPSEFKTDIINLAVFHTLKYSKKRDGYFISDYLYAEDQDNSLTSTDSIRLFDFSKIGDDVKSCPEEEKDRLLKAFKIEILDAVVGTHDEALREIINRVGSNHALTFEVKESGGISLEPEINIEWTVDKSDFTIWNNLSKPSPGKMFDLHIVPDYHPCMSEKMNDVGFINGSTDAYIRGYAIDSIYPPIEAMVQREKTFGSSWSYINHPFKATGKTFTMRVSYFKLFTEMGINEITVVLKAALNSENTYLSVSGGFYGPYDHQENVLNRLLREGITEFQNSKRNRGSEPHCMWAYYFLEKEGSLYKAYVPNWFYEERWREAYALDEKNRSAHKV